MRLGGGTRASGGGTYPLAVGAGDVGVGTRHQPHSASFCTLRRRQEGAWGGGSSCLGVGRPGLGALSRPTARPCGVRPGPSTHWLWVRRLWAWRPVTNSTARALAIWLCAPWGRHEGAHGGRGHLPGCGASGSGRSPTPDRPSLGCAAGAPYPLAVRVGGVGLGALSATPQRALLRAVRAARGRPRGGRCLPRCGAPGVGRSCTPTARPCCVRPGPATHWLWVRFSLAPSPVPRFVVCCSSFPGLRHLLAVVAWHLSLYRVCGWRCLVPRGPALVRRPLSGPVAPGAPVSFPVSVVPPPTPWAVAPGITRRLRWPRGGRPGTRLIVPAAGP